MSGIQIGQRIADPRVLSDELGSVEDSMYSTLSSYTFGSPACQYDSLDDPDVVSPLSFPDRTPRPSVSVSSHPSQGAVDPSPSALHLIPDNASQHTFGRASRVHGVTAADGAAPSSPPSISTSRSSSRTSMRSTEQFSSDDELEVDYCYSSSSPVTFARDDLPELDQDVDFVAPRPSSFSLFDRRRGSLPMAIPGANDPYAARSREGSILTVRRPSRSWDDSSVYRSDDPSIILPMSEPISRAARLSLEAQYQSRQQLEPDVYHGLDLQYIISRRSEGSIRSFNSRLSFVQPGSSTHRRPSPHLTAIPLGLGSTTTLPFEDAFMAHVRKHDTSFDALRFYWSFQREKADASSASARRKQQNHRNDKSVNDTPSRVQEMWRCGHVGRFKIDRLVFRPDPAKAAQQRIQVRHIPDPFIGNTANGPHSVIHKHSRAVAFSIFRSHGLFSGGVVGGVVVGVGGGRHPGAMHMNVRSGTMLALKKVQEQYTSTKTVRQLGPFQSGDQKLKGDKENKGQTKVKAPGKSRSKDKGDKKNRQPTENAESSAATSSAGSVANSVIHQMASVPEHPIARIRFSPGTSSSTSVYNHDSVDRPISSASTLPTTVEDSPGVTEGETALVAASIRHLRDHRDSIDSEDRPVRTTHAEAFSTLDPNDIESLRAKAHSRTNADSSSTLERFLRVVFPRSSKTDEHSSSGSQNRAFQPPWLTTAGRDQQEENDRVLDDLNASFRDVGLLHTNPHKPTKSGPKQKSREGVLDQIPDDCLYMLLPLWPGESDMASVRAETSSTAAASLGTELKNRQYLLVYYVPFEKSGTKDKKAGKKKAKQSHSSDSGMEQDAKAAFLPTFRVVARVVAYDELQLSGIRIPNDGLAISGPEWEAINYPAPSPLRDAQMIDTVVCQCDSREGGFNFLEHGLLKLGLCTREESQSSSSVFPSELDPEEADGKSMLTPIGRAAVEMIWLGCLAITSFGPT